VTDKVHCLVIILDVRDAQIATTHLPIDVDEWNFAATYMANTGNSPFDQNEQK